MLANLITTILLAFGVATGNVSSNVYKGGNAFNHELKETTKSQPTKRAVITQNTDIYFNKVSTVLNTADKYYLQTPNNIVDPNYTNDYYNIYNTTYSFTKVNSNTNETAYLISIFILTTYYYYNYQDFTLTQNAYIANVNDNFNATIYYEAFTTNPTDVSNYVDLTLTQANMDALVDLANNNNIKSNLVSSHTYLGQIAQNTTYDNATHNQYIVQNIQARQTVQIMLVTAIDLNGSVGFFSGAKLTPEKLNISGEAVIPNTNYEVVDIPNLMFTIITLPFAWYSTAFNLTVFPGTPYQINFGNIILTIIGALILLYLIKKVIK